jgi:hypothetical protein
LKRQAFCPKQLALVTEKLMALSMMCRCWMREVIVVGEESSEIFIIIVESLILISVKLN